jgi:hypothetical protein
MAAGAEPTSRSTGSSEVTEGAAGFAAEASGAAGFALGLTAGASRTGIEVLTAGR